VHDVRAPLDGAAPLVVPGDLLDGAQVTAARETDRLAQDQQRRCASGGRCANRERETAAGRMRWVGTLLTRPEGLCPDCLWRVEQSIAQLPADVLVLTALIAPTGSGPGAFVSRSRDLSVNIRLGVEALRAEIDFETGYWAEVVAAEVGASFDVTACRLPVRVQRAVLILQYRVDTLVQLGPQERTAWTPDGEPLRDYWGDREAIAYTGLGGVLRLGELHHRVRRVAGRTQLVHRLTPACPWCDQCALVRHNGSDFVQCEHCGRPIAERHYDWFVKATIAAEEQRRLAVAA